MVDVTWEIIFYYSVWHISFFYPSNNGKVQINTILKRLKIKLRYIVKDRDRLCNLPKQILVKQNQEYLK